MLELHTDAPIAGVAAHRQHVGPVERSAIHETGDAEDEADELAAVVRAEQHTADAPREPEDRVRHALAEPRPPGGLLQRDACTQLRRTLQRPDRHSVRSSW